MRYRYVIEEQTRHRGARKWTTMVVRDMGIVSEEVYEKAVSDETMNFFRRFGKQAVKHSKDKRGCIKHCLESRLSDLDMEEYRHIHTWTEVKESEQ